MAVCVLFVAFAAILGYYFWAPWQGAHAATADRMPSLPDIQVPDTAALEEMARLGKRLNRLAYPHKTGAQAVYLQLFGYTPAATGLQAGQGSGQIQVTPPAQFDYVLSFALAAGPRQLCMLDGQLYARGATLPDGGQITAIEPDRVLIEKPPLQRWIYLQEPELGREASSEARAPIPSTHEEL